ncbi:hypothetical protein CRM22_004335 [Opisthorchis felineus]|uniref:Coiled-coil domain-containing protein 170 n=1 Tax=Opisthorchis felineus TaxID=147828 RepID=A0A4S2M375_OPIFE|nr:hypothetical protein CRM22_004335 [Opisthorchis felineus]
MNMYGNNSYVIELEEKVKAYRSEIEKKDELIRKLSSMDITVTRPVQEPLESREHSKSQGEELAILRSKVEQLCEKTLNQEAEIKAQAKIIAHLEDEKRKLSAQLKEMSAESSRTSGHVGELRSKTEQAEVEKMLCIKRSEELGVELRRAKEEAAELERRLQYQTAERERHEFEAGKAEERLAYFVSQMIRIFDAYVREEDLAGDQWKDEARLSRLISQAAEIVNENMKNRGQVQELCDRIKQRDIQIAERNRVVDRLGEQLTRTMASDREVENLAQELECSRGKERAMEDRLHKLTGDLMDAQVRVRELERQLAQAVHEKEHAATVRQGLTERDYMAFKDAIAAILSSPHYPCSPTEVAIKEHARRIVTECKEQKEMCAKLESRISELSSRWDRDQMSRHEYERQISRTDKENEHLREQIRRLESELGSSHVLRDQQRDERDQLFFYLCKLATKVRIDQTTASRMKLHELQEALSTRINQIVSGEFGLLTDVQANADRIAGLSRTVKRLQDQLASKEIQLSMWRDKAAKLESKLQTVSEAEAALEVERENTERAIAKGRRKESENAKLRDELNRLRADLLDLSDAKTQCVITGERIKELEKTNKELEDVRERQTSEANESRDLVDKLRTELTDLQNRSKESMSRVNDELTRTHAVVEQLKRSESELLEFRALVSRLLGLQSDTLTVPNYEIVTRLEQVLADYQLLNSDGMKTISERRVIGGSPQYPVGACEAGWNGEFMAGPGLAKAGSKEAWNPTRDVSPAAVHKRLQAVSVRPRELRSEEKRVETSSPTLMKRDPRKY